MEKRTTKTNKVDVVMAVMIILRGIRAGLLSVDDVLAMLLDDGQVETLMDAEWIIINRFIMTPITEEQKRLFMDYHGIRSIQDCQGLTDNDVYFSDLVDLITEEDDEPDWPSY